MKVDAVTSKTRETVFYVFLTDFCQHLNVFVWKRGEEVETKVNVSDAFLFSQQPRSLVAFQVGLSSNSTERENLASDFYFEKNQCWKMSRFQAYLIFVISFTLTGFSKTIETGVFTFGRKVVFGLKMGFTPKNHPKWHFPPWLFGQRHFFSLNNFFQPWPEHG